MHTEWSIKWSTYVNKTKTKVMHKKNCRTEQSNFKFMCFHDIRDVCNRNNPPTDSVLIEIGTCV